MTTFKEAATYGGVKDTIANKLSETWPADLGGISKALIDAGMTAGPRLVQIAQAINALRPTQQQPAAPIHVTFVDPNDLSRVVLADLLTQIVANPTDMRLRQELGRRVEYKTATQAARDLTAVLTPDWKQLDVPQTMEYWHHLSRGGQVLTSFKNHRVATLAEALGLVEKSLARPDPLGGTKPVVNKIDPILGDEWKISDDLWAALVWAYTTGHQLWPTNLDRFTAYTELHLKRLPNRWQKILDDYRKHTSRGGAAINLEDPSLLQPINRAARTSQSPGATAGYGTSPQGGSKLQLYDILAELHGDQQSIRRIAGDAGLDVRQIAFDARANNSWSAVVQEALLQGLLPCLLDVATQNYPPRWNQAVYEAAQREGKIKLL